MKPRRPYQATARLASLTRRTGITSSATVMTLPARPVDRDGLAAGFGDMVGDRRILVANAKREAARRGRQNPAVGSPQTLSEAERRIVAAWAANCVERVLPFFEAEAPGDRRPHDAILRTRAFARGELDVATQIRRRFAGGRATLGVGPAAAAAARAAGQASAIAHMGAHALGAAAYA